MDMKWPLRILFWIAALSPLVIAVCFIPFAPEQAAVHFNALGIADRWGSPLELFAPGIIGLLTATTCEIYLSHNRSSEKTLRLICILLFLTLSIPTAIICSANAGTAEGADEAPALSLLRFIPFVCWTGMGIFFLVTRTVRYLNLDAPWLLLDHKKDRKAALFGSVVMLLAGCFSLVVSILAKESAFGCILSSLAGCIGLLALYIHARCLRTCD